MVHNNLDAPLVTVVPQTLLLFALVLGRMPVLTLLHEQQYGNTLSTTS